ncbi:uncharacterized protein LOC108222725 [Daucus carota subsp. sativus]
MLAIFGLGLIVSRQRLSSQYCKEKDEDHDNNHLHIFWAPFLLLHLGGPDTITAFAPEDNELWLRHLFYLASQCIAVAYAFYQFLEYNDVLRTPTILMFLCGIIKCAERTCALYYGSANSFRNSMLSRPDSEAKDDPRNENTALIKTNKDALSHLQVLQYAFLYFTAFKGLVVDLILSIHERNQSREFFLAKSCDDAFKLVEVELNYLYDVLFTKLSVLHHKIGYFFRTLSFIAVVASFMLYHSHQRKHDLHNDVVITYTLLIGAIVLEVIAFYMLLFTDWTVIRLRPLSDTTPNSNSWKDKFLSWILVANNTRSVFLQWFLHLVGDKDHHPELEYTDCRWAGCLSTFNLIHYCLHKRSNRKESIYNFFGLVGFLNEVWYVKPHRLTHNITGFIFEELKKKSEKAHSLAMAKEICSSKGEWVLNEMEDDLGNFLPFVANFNYDDILLVWHIATEVCYVDSQEQQNNKERCDLRDTAKKLSDYMLYLMVMKPDMMSAVSCFGEIKFRDTCTEAADFFGTKLPELNKRKFCKFFRRESINEKEALQKKACEAILNISTEDEMLKDKQIFFIASALAKKLKAVPSDKKWLIISKLWVEQLSYAASHIRSYAHAVQLSKGGEFITIVWLLMAHFGLGDQYEINLGNPE